MPLPSFKLLAGLALLSLTACAPVKKSEPESTAPVANVTAATRKEAVEKIAGLIRKKNEKRVYTAPGGHGWIEQYTLVNVEDAGIEPIKNGKTAMTCRITFSVTRWKTHNGKTKGEPTHSETVSVRRYTF